MSSKYKILSNWIEELNSSIIPSVEEENLPPHILLIFFSELSFFIFLSILGNNLLLNLIQFLTCIHQIYTKKYYYYFL